MEIRESSSTESELVVPIAIADHKTFWGPILVVFTSILLSLIILVAICGNLLVILAVSLIRQLRGRLTNWFIVNLAVADLLVSVLTMPISAVSMICGEWYFGKVYCEIWKILDVTCCTASILSLCAISIDRYIGVTYPLTYVNIMTRKRRMLLLIAVWTVALGSATLIPYLMWPDKNSIHQNQDGYNQYQCNVNTTFGNAMTGSILCFFLPAIVIVVVYWRIYRVAKIHEDSLTRNLDKTANAKGSLLQKHVGAAQNKNAIDSGAADGNLNVDVRSAKFRRQKKAAKTVAMIVGAFFICWLPFFILYLLSSLSVDFENQETFLLFFMWLGYVNSATNPFIYAATSHKFRVAFKKILTLKFGE